MAKKQKTDPEIKEEVLELSPDSEQADDEIEEEFDITQADEHAILLNVVKAYEETKKKRNDYKKYGPLAVLITGVVFLALMFTLDTKIEFLILWVVSDFYIAALMIRAEYKYHKFRQILGLTEKEKSEETVEEEEKEEEE